MENLKKNYQNATGKIDYTLLNDYMFRMIMQKHKNVLKGLTCATLQLAPEEILDLNIKNPIEFGAAIDNKEFILDIKVLLNNDTIINFELQVVNYANWPDRSLSYLCRNFDSLHHGEDYISSKRAIHVGILDFDPFPECPEFFSQYKMLNIKNHHLYNDKFQIRVLKLNSVELATEEDKKFGLDKWAALFMAKTWEEIKQLTKENPEMEAASEQLFEYNAEEDMRYRAQARADYLFYEKQTQREMAELRQQLDEQSAQLDEQTKQLDEQSAQLDEKNKQLDEQSAQLDEKNKQLDEQSQQIAELKRQLAEFQKQ